MSSAWKPPLPRSFDLSAGVSSKAGEDQVAKAKGRLRGKQPKLSPTQEAHLVKLYRAGEHTVSELEELFGITRSTVYRAIRRVEASKAGSAGVI